MSRPQNRRQNTHLLAALLAVVFIGGCDRGDHPQHLGKVAPDFTVNDGSSSVHLADYHGKVVLLNFWSTTCIPCIAELPSLQALHQAMPQVVVLAVSIDDDPDAYHRFLLEHPLQLLTVDDSAQHVNKLYGTSLVPETYVIDRDGRIRRKFVSAQQWTNPEIVNYLSHL